VMISYTGAGFRVLYFVTGYSSDRRRRAIQENC
jgi:hypothetical protein